MKRQVAHNLGRRGHLDEASKHPVRGSVRRLDLLEVVAQPKCRCLRTEVCELASWDLVGVHASGWAAKARLERTVQGAHCLPVWLEVAYVLERESGVPVRVLECCNQRRHGWLRGGAGHGGARHVHRVYPGLGGSKQCSHLATGGVVRVQVNRKVKAFAQSGHEPTCRLRTEQASHVLDADDVRAGLDDAIRKFEVVVERVDVLVRVEQVTCVAQGHLGNRGSGRPDCLDRWAHLLNIVQRVEDAEDVHAARCRFLDEGVRDLGGVRRVSHRVAPAEQHLNGDVGHCLTQLVEALPGVLTQEAQCDIVRCATPCFHREELWCQVCNLRRSKQEVTCANARSQERLVCIAEGRIGHRKGLLLAQRAGEAFRAQL